MSAEEIIDNIVKVHAEIVSHLPLKQNHVLTMYVKAHKATSFPIHVQKASEIVTQKGNSAIGQKEFVAMEA